MREGIINLHIGYNVTCIRNDTKITVYKDVKRMSSSVDNTKTYCYHCKHNI